VREGRGGGEHGVGARARGDINGPVAGGDAACARGAAVGVGSDDGNVGG
jgi:hypothetical protein